MLRRLVEGLQPISMVKRRKQIKYSHNGIGLLDIGIVLQQLTQVQNSEHGTAAYIEIMTSNYENRVIIH